MSKYRFNTKMKDADLNNVLRQIEDNLATQTEVNNKMHKTIAIVTAPPILADMQDGDEKIYNDGSNVYLYRRTGGRLFKLQMTEA
jgi:hypothetical protein